MPAAPLRLPRAWNGQSFPESGFLSFLLIGKPVLRASQDLSTAGPAVGQWQQGTLVLPGGGGGEGVDVTAET